MKIDWKIKAIAALLVLAGGAFGGYRYYTAQQETKQMAAVETVRAEHRDMKSTVSATGTITPVDSVEVSPKITARITSVLVKENDEVTAGQIVATLDGKDFEAKRDQAQYKVTNTKSKYNRTAYLYSIGAKSKEELEDARLDYDTAQSSLVSAESDVNNTIITAPMDGVVVGEPQSVGTMAVQGNSSPTVIMRIADLSSKQILAKVDETDIGSVKVGQEATFTVDAYTGKTFRARVSKISQTDTANSWNVNKSSSGSSSSSSSSASVIYYYVTLDVEDPENQLLPAMTARVDITTASRDGVLSVPLSALKTDSAGSYVILVHPDGQQENRYVETGIYDEDYVEILSGLEEGDEISSSYTAQKSSSKSSGRGARPPHM
ncbi:MAG: efflux RND transporter periplasmic adaptor subunit [Selenomonadaceae bacterium]|nr:efflux RND transporter periplasmic adaptor subunit [Selenomonadaceae bacterium]MBR4694594.1 efflux RND transporter periplasmic adaptor subunit [Selenomonadaceae bacterium]